MNFRRLPLAVLLIAASAAQVVWCVRLTRANLAVSEDTVNALQKAVALAPCNADYYARLATLDPDHRARWLGRALELNPRNALLWIERGVNAEVSGDAAAAEASLLEAARWDHQYVPRWTLAAFYFRQRDPGKFRAWARQALEMAWGDALPLFQMAAQLGMSLGDIRAGMLPDRPPVLAAFIGECARRSDFDQVARTARRLIEIGSSDDRLAVLYAVESLFQAGRIPESMDVWNRAVGARWITHGAVSSQALLSNSDFAAEFLPAGLDWKQPVIDGVTYWRLGPPRGLGIELSGREPENCVLLAVPFPAEPGRRYAIETSVTLNGVAEGSGLKWKLGDREWDIKESSMSYEAPGKAAPVQLLLSYNRAVGTRRIEGSISIQKVTASEGSK